MPILTVKPTNDGLNTTLVVEILQTDKVKKVKKKIQKKYPQYPSYSIDLQFRGSHTNNNDFVNFLAEPFTPLVIKSIIVNIRSNISTELLPLKILMTDTALKIKEKIEKEYFQFQAELFDLIWRGKTLADTQIVNFGTETVVTMVFKTNIESKSILIKQPLKMDPLQLTVFKTDNISKIKKKIVQRWPQYQANSLHLLYRGRRAEDNEVIDLLVDEFLTLIQIYSVPILIQNMNEQFLRLDILSTDTVLEVKQKLQKNHPEHFPDNFDLVHAEKPLYDDELNGLTDHTELTMVPKVKHIKYIDQWSKNMQNEQSTLTIHFPERIPKEIIDKVCESTAEQNSCSWIKNGTEIVSVFAREQYDAIVDRILSLSAPSRFLFTPELSYLHYLLINCRLPCDLQFCNQIIGRVGRITVLECNVVVNEGGIAVYGSKENIKTVVKAFNKAIDTFNLLRSTKTRQLCSTYNLDGTIKQLATKYGVHVSLSNNGVLQLLKVQGFTSSVTKAMVEIDILLNGSQAWN